MHAEGVHWWSTCDLIAQVIDCNWFNHILWSCPANLTLQVAKAHPNDRDAKLKFTECSKIVKRIAFEKAISVADTKKSVVDQINLESMSMSFCMQCFNIINV